MDEFNDISNVITSCYGEIESILSVRGFDNKITGQFLDDGYVFDYQITPDTISYKKK
jgi:hypothetical protein